MTKGGGYAIPTSKPFTIKKREGSAMMSSHRKAVKAFCRSHDISFDKGENGSNIYIITEKQTGKQTIGQVMGDE